MESYKRRQEGPQGPFTSAACSSTHGGYNGLGAPEDSSTGSVYVAKKRPRLGPPGSSGGVASGEVDGGAAPLPAGEGGGPRVLPLCLLVSENAAGALIGKGGHTVREFEKSSGARILVQRNTLGPQELAEAQQAAADTAGVPPGQTVDVVKVVAITGPSEEEQLDGLRRVLRLLATHPGQSVGGRVSVLLLVPYRSVGGIVGHRGRTIEELSQKSHAAIRVVPGRAAPNGDRALCITSQKDEHVGLAIHLLQQHIQQMFARGRLNYTDAELILSLASVPQPKALRAAKQQPAGPSPVAPLSAALAPAAPRGGPPAGGFGGASGWGAVAAAGGAPPMAAAGGGGLQGPPLSDSHHPQAGAVAGGPPSRGPPSHGRSYAFVASVERSGGGPCSSVLCLVVPQRLAAWVVGPQGSHVKALREETGVQVQVLDEVLGLRPEDVRRMTKGAPGGPQGASSHGEGGGGPEGNDRFCMVSGGVASLCGAVLRLGVSLDEKLQQLQQPLRLLVPARFVTHLIGSRGSVIREMQQASGASIQISKGPGGPAAGGGGPLEQNRIVFIEGPSAPRLVALALIWQRILGVEYPDLAAAGTNFFCVSALADDLQQQGLSTAALRLPAPTANPALLHQQQHQQRGYAAEETAASYYEGPPSGSNPPPAWGPPPPDPSMAGGPPASAWAGDEAGWGAPPKDGGGPTFDQVESVFRDFCLRFLSPQEAAACSSRQTVKLLLSQQQGEALLRREQPNSLFGGPHGGPSPNALDQISEMTGCHIRCFITQEGGPQGVPTIEAPQQQMVLVLTGSVVANSLAVMLAQARLLQL